MESDNAIINFTSKERDSLIKRISKPEFDKPKFKLWVQLSNEILVKSNIPPDHVRMAMRPNDFMVILGMRAILSYQQNSKKSILSFILPIEYGSTLKIESEEEFSDSNNEKNKYKWVSYEIEDIKSIPEDMISVVVQSIVENYSRVKESKFIDWNQDAMTTNNALKTLIFSLRYSDFELSPKIYWHIQMSYPYGRDGDKMDTLPMLQQKKPVIGTGKWEDSSYYQFVGDRENSLKIGDVILIRDGQTPLALARVTGSAFNDKKLEDEFLHTEYRNVEILDFYNGKEKFNQPQGTLQRLINPNTLSYKFIDQWYQSLSLSKLSHNKQSNMIAENNPLPLNQILYGPPGTGKTFKTKELAVKIIDGEAPDDRRELTDRYLELINSGQVHFTTFHQSMSYEDFIEGIKPKMTDDNSGEIEYEIRSGLFKIICELATIKEVTNFNKAYNDLLKDLSESEKEYLILYTPRNKEFRVNLNSNDNLNLFTSSEINKQGVLSKQKLERQYQGEKEYYGWEGYAKGVIDYLENNYNLSKKEKQADQKYVLIIDEINRGNVSAIFGELITLIEDDKRAGEEEALEVTLPYSKEKFSVPKNIHIIGTMNTADRSVEALDTALRRRFSFEEIAPKAELLSASAFKDVDLYRLLTTINQRIELLIDKDHQIGHSYFLRVQNFEDLKTTFRDKIIPLLEEYFYGDFGKIGLVLGGEFVKPIEVRNKNILAQNFKYETDFIEEKELYQIVNTDDWTTETFTSVYLDTPFENE